MKSRTVQLTTRERRSAGRKMRSTLVVAMLLLVATFPLRAQEEEAVAEVPMVTQRLPDKIAEQFDTRLDAIEDLKGSLVTLDARLAESEGLITQVLWSRIETMRTRLFNSTLSLARDVAEQNAQGFDVSVYKEILIVDLKVFPEQARIAMDRLGDAININYDELGPKDTVIADRRLLLAVQRVDAVLNTLVDYTEVAEGMGLDDSEELVFLDETLVDAAAMRSVFLDVALRQVNLARSSAATLPTDEELPQWVLAAEARVNVASQALQSTVNLMNRLKMDTRQYRQQIVTATGELTTDVLDLGVVAGILSEWGRLALEFSTTQGPRLIFRILLVVLIIFAAVYLGKLVQRGVEKALQSGKVKLSHLLRRMIVSTVKNIVIFLGILFALSQMGISLGPLLAGLGIAGFIVGFALQDTLSNFASGMMILVYRPFDVGDFVDAGGVTGRVDRMSLVNTTFKTLDNQVIVVPNNLIWQQVITNLTAQRTRRVDLTFGISYSDDIDKAKSILRDVVDNYDACLNEPEPNIRVAALGESSVDLICRPWVRTDDYWDTYWSLTEIVKKRFDEEGISIPFPQRDVHMIPQPES